MQEKSNRLQKLFFNPGLFLLLCTFISLLVSNTTTGNLYREFWHYSMGFTVGQINLPFTLADWVNEGLMTFFFLLVGLEIKREFVSGELSSKKKAMLPFMAAFGGMIVPAIIFYSLNYHTAAESGWGIPMATDIAFALAVLSVIARHVPPSLRIFLTALAIIDDLGAILVIAFFYTASFSIIHLALVAFIMLVLLMLNKAGVNRGTPYILAGIILWYALLKSGIHATVAGVILALFIPLKKQKHPSLLHRFEHLLTPVCSWFILPLFVLANTALQINGSLINQINSAPAIGILAGLIIGKPLGITLFSAIATRLKIAGLPAGINMRLLCGAGMLGGIGFTMSVFISMLAFSNTALQDLSKFAVLTASSIASVSGYFFLKYELKRNARINAA